MTREQEHYHSFLLRLWRAGNDGEPVWRASLEHPHTGERLGFASLGALLDYLEAQIEEVGLAAKDSPGESRLTFRTHVAKKGGDAIKDTPRLAQVGPRAALVVLGPEESG